MKTILLKLSGPMQAFGTSSNFETRYTDYYPSKSAIVGMLAASLGYRRDDCRIEKINEIDFAVRVDQKPNLIRDYQIAQKYKTNGTIARNYVTNRYYLEDGIFIVAIGARDELIEELYEALNRPYFQVFMGRRSCPPPADFILNLVEEEPIEALKNLSWQASSYFKRRNKFYKANIYADNALIEGRKIRRNDRVISFSQKRREFSIRFESENSIDFSDEYQTSHDPFEGIKE
ncbi:type I-E CRISPR-associated protein Cas5/CasD [Anaerococcus tetradius]|uniref:type I-E CRISPR-associated protein Cas5/CasD n=1 Tax=Anaerococcus tetradius TaxID=33036 RepID=UPI0023F2F12C|nr:type I-E CRISPR-associated protein Cas5/CasD [Anaerococcus tetradius]